ncbi:MAG TPA: hypothetical protein VMF56_04400 [Acidobacteriaceae bacterium]|nr:hypothetical protein [Acidobacteriaceae bacterium]
MKRAVLNARGTMRSGSGMSTSMLPIVCGILVFTCMPGTGAAKKAERVLTASDGKPVRKVYVDAGTPVMANAAITRLDQDTCLTIVSSPKQADAILEVGIALPSVGGDSGGPDIFGSQPKAQTLGNAHSSPKRSASATCSDGKGGTMDCKSSYTVGGDAPEQPAADWTQGITPSYTVSLASSEDSTQDLWDPNGREKHSSWSDQLREAVGCPVCPGEEFNPKRDKMSYREWMQAKCPNVLKVAAE